MITVDTAIKRMPDHQAHDDDDDGGGTAAGWACVRR